MREYLASHPWITFQFDAGTLNPACWMLLGELKAGCQRIADVPLQPDVAEQLREVLVSKGAHATAAIEGNTLSEDEVLKRIQGELPLPASQEELGTEIDNIGAVYNKICRGAFSGEDHNLSVDEICEFNRLFLKGITLEKEVSPGKIRKHSVGVRHYRGAPWQDCPYLLQKLCDWINGPKWPSGFEYAILRAIITHIYIAWIHPFGDGNGRAARAAEIKVLLCSGVPDIAAHLLTTHYNRMRNEYYRQLDYTSESGGDINRFIEFALRGFSEALGAEFDLIKAQHLRITWRNYIYDFFKGRRGGVDDRRRALLLDLSDHDDPIPFQKVRRVSPRVAEFYAEKTDMTLRRDLQYLASNRLVIVTKNQKFAANKSLVKAFLPYRAPQNPAGQQKQKAIA